MDYLLAITSAVWLGILTSISPCPLATNIAAISYIGRRAEHPTIVLLTGLLYTVGRTLAYVVLAVLLVGGVLSIPEMKLYVSRHINQALGPILVVGGMFLLGLIGAGATGAGISEKMQKRVDAMGIWGALLLGVLFALSFCPVSGVFFVGLLSLALESDSAIIIPSFYGVGTALPVFAFALLIALSTRWVGKAFNTISKIEWWARQATGVFLILLGIYFSLKFIFEVI